MKTVKYTLLSTLTISNLNIPIQVRRYSVRRSLDILLNLIYFYYILFVLLNIFVAVIAADNIKKEPAEEVPAVQLGIRPIAHLFIVFLLY